MGEGYASGQVGQMYLGRHPGVEAAARSQGLRCKVGTFRTLSVPLVECVFDNTGCVWAAEARMRLLREMKLSGQKEVALTDPECRLMKNHGRIEPCYNVHEVVD